MKIIFPVALIVVAGILGYVAFFKAEAPSSGAPTSSAMPAPGYEGVEEMIVAEDGGVYAVSEVATHTSAASCWTIIRGSVYDLTAWIEKHPGGQEAILKTCGIDATALFENQHGGMEKQEAALTTFKIGVVAE